MLEPHYWNWFVLAAILIGIEVIAPSTFFLWVGIAALLVGGVVILVPDISWQAQLLLFSVLSVSSIVVWFLYFKNREENSEEPLLNKRGHQYVGRTFTLTEPVVNRQGKIKVDDSTWKIQGKDCPAGTHVKVVGVDGVVLLVDGIE